MFKVIDNKFVGEIETEELVELLRGFSKGQSAVGYELLANALELAANRLEDQRQDLHSWIVINTMFKERDEYKRHLEWWRKKNHKNDLTYPDAGEVYKDFWAMKEDRDHLLKIAKKMHFWIFDHSIDEYEAYKECGLTDEDDARLGYGGRFIISGEIKGELE